MMERGRKSYVKSLSMYDVSLSKNDSYFAVISKICDTLCMDGDNDDDLRLFNGKGAVIPYQSLQIRDKEVDWILGAFLLKTHTSPDKTSFGVGILDPEDEPRCKRSKGSYKQYCTVISPFILFIIGSQFHNKDQHSSRFPLEASSTDVINVVFLLLYIMYIYIYIYSQY